MFMSSRKGARGGAPFFSSRAARAGPLNRLRAPSPKLTGVFPSRVYDMSRRFVNVGADGWRAAVIAGVRGSILRSSERAAAPAGWDPEAQSLQAPVRRLSMPVGSDERRGVDGHAVNARYAAHYSAESKGGDWARRRVNRPLAGIKPGRRSSLLTRRLLNATDSVPRL